MKSSTIVNLLAMVGSGRVAMAEGVALVVLEKIPLMEKRRGNAPMEISEIPPVAIIFHARLRRGSEPTHSTKRKIGIPAMGWSAIVAHERKIAMKNCFRL